MIIEINATEHSFAVASCCANWFLLLTVQPKSANDSDLAVILCAAVNYVVPGGYNY